MKAFEGEICLTSAHCLLMEAEMKKTRHTLRLTPDTARRLKVMSAMVGKTQGELLEALLIMVADGRLTDEEMSRALAESWLRGYSLPQGGPR
jgi:hypothetical protein